MPALLQGLGGFDRALLREGAAALSLWPENADRHAALQALIEALGSEPEAGGKEAIGGAEWAAWLAGEEGKTLQAIQPDGYEDAPSSVETTILGTRQCLLGGQLKFPAVHYQLWTEALAAANASAEDPHLEAGLELLSATLSLCTRIAEYAEIGGYGWLQRQRSRPVAVPPEEEFELLRAVLRIEFDDPETERILATLQRGPEAPSWQPLSREGESTFLITNPRQLCRAALIWSIHLAARSPRWATVLAEVRRAALAVVAEAVKEMGWTVERVEGDHLVARADVDCLVLVGVGVISPDPAQLGAESLNIDADLSEWLERTASRARSLGAGHSLLVLVSDGHAIISDDDSLRGTVESDPWMVGVGELRAIGEALRTDPLALPTALRSIKRPPWPENSDLLDWVGMVRKAEEEPLVPEQRDRELDGTEHMLMRGRVMATRHPAPAPSLVGWTEVTRWEGVEEPAIFCGRDADEFALLVRASGRYLWVTCPGDLERRYELLPVVATTLAYWLARLHEAGFLAPPPEPFYARFRLELDRRAGPQLAIAQSGTDTRIVLGPGFVEAMCHGNSESDRMLVGAVLSWAERDRAETPALDEIVPKGQGTLVIWPRPEATANPPRLDPPPPVEQRFRRGIKQALASAVSERGETLVVGDEGLAPALEGLARTLEDAIQEKLDSLGPEALRALVALHERVTFRSMTEAVLMPARSVMRFAETYQDSSLESFHRDLVLRILIERCSATPPSGSKPFGREAGAWLRAATELQLELRGALDTVLWEKTGGSVVVSPEQGIFFDLDSELADASQAMRDQVVAAAPSLMTRVHSDWWGEQLPEPGSAPALDRPIELEGGWMEMDQAMAEEWGVGFEQLVRLLYALGEIADEEPDCVGRLSPDRVRTELAKRTAIPAGTVGCAVGRLTLSPCPGYDSFDEEHQPGRANRERSYMRRPLVTLPDGALCWSSLHCKRAAQYLTALVENGRLQTPGRLGKAVMKISQGLDFEFEDAVLAAVHDCDWQGKARLEQVGGRPLRRRRGEGIGDVDVLAWSLARREVWLLDAKRLNPGVEPGPMLREGDAFEKHAKSHEERLQWVRDHLPELADEIGVETVEGWTIQAALVLDRPLTGAHMSKISMPIWTLWSLPRELSADGKVK